MKCQEVNKLLVAYLDNEVTPSEQTLIRAHLAGCDTCQQELVALSALQSRINQTLQLRAAQAAPSPQAWSRLQARLAGEARPSLLWLSTWLQRLAPGVGQINPIFRRGVTMKKGFALTAIVALVLALSVMAFVPSVRAQVGDLVGSWFRIEVRGGEVTMSGSTEFRPLRPTYLPAGFQLQSSGFKVSNESASVELIFRSADQFVTITQAQALADRTLPAGQKMTINGQPAVLVTGLEGTFEVAVPAGAQVETVGTPPGSITYTDGKQLIWYVGDIKVEMLSNLSVEEMLRIGASLVPAEESNGEPVPPPCDPAQEGGCITHESKP